ncbi:hypothetical protein O181_091016 [Austropuccinia psidii MF-1]|uniref:Uncharacterized protein n=1 Tax=Austropuccinia psidii MF-1 TaxID=1389203 RepID=A0A9Q3P986_9BASI|nr:hypothetical protein [Austropuccinia psidii MF-1]
MLEDWWKKLVKVLQHKLSLRKENSKVKRKGKIPSGTEYTQGSAISQRQLPEIPIISEPELELSLSNSNRYTSHSEASDRHLQEQVEAVLQILQGQILGNVAQIHQGVMNFWNIVKKFFKEEETVRYSNGWNPLSSKHQKKKIKDWHNNKRDTSKEEAPVAPTRK